MCGIVGYLGSKGAYEILIQGLKRLEYRGYDSAGVALLDCDGKLNVHKSQGKVSNLEKVAQAGNTNGSVGIAHTRWATHGEPNDINAHPHVSQSGMIALVHNGTIENYAVLKKVLMDHGYEFKSETDTEVLVQLIEYIKLTSSCSLLDAVRAALLQVEGAYAIAVIEQNDPDTMIVARKSSPLVIGVGDGETFIASDATPIIDYTDEVIYLNDNEIGIIRRNEPVQVISLESKEPSAINIQKLKLSVAQLEKGGYDTFMLKEIFEQPSTLRDCLRGRIVDNCSRVVLSGVELNKERFMKAERITLVACGTSWHAALIGKRLIQDFCQIPVEVEYASEFRYGNPVLNDKDIVISISQSGETADTLAAIQLARQKGAFVYGVCNVVGASIPRNTDSGTYIHVGPEIGVASTKAFTGQVTVLTLLALSIAQLRGTIRPEKLHEILSALERLPETITEALKVDPEVKKLSRIFAYAHNFLYLGRGYNYPTALEGALKLKEISYIHAEGYPAAEMKHGPIALIDHEMPSVIIAPSDSLYDKIISNVQQVKSRGGAVVAIVSHGNQAMNDIADFCIEIPEAPECLTPIVASIPLQLLAYYIAVNKGKNVDQPRNLAKSVTVE
ncbi:MAG: glutamine--fructose-6-phosphate transaminase (isomerizing) [Duncaniella sp.]|uniref:glutamine--fructose-6-phosphate transaminase (isomerizing) n=1 Tax=Duncaniella sp. TaxID=2518496 RepID=UPI0023C5DF90|nr:glutamine--fructose-6-phosphate transaminase (isomerizing) [Duncaniella sp.]MDE6091052.1 glutamine--fructose-6-phosphate transaminase (isomerizing) [Duncaniella sp.]